MWVGFRSILFFFPFFFFWTEISSDSILGGPWHHFKKYESKQNYWNCLSSFFYSLLTRSSNSVHWEGLAWSCRGTASFLKLVNNIKVIRLRQGADSISTYNNLLYFCTWVIDWNNLSFDQCFPNFLNYQLLRFILFSSLAYILAQILEEHLCLGCSHTTGLTQKFVWVFP